MGLLVLIIIGKYFFFFYQLNYTELPCHENIDIRKLKDLI